MGLSTKTRANCSKMTEKVGVAKLKSIEDMKVAQGIRAIFEEIMKVDAEKADMLNYHLNPIQIEKLFEEISWG
ncbi:MAG: hypothetical protein EZS28_033748 [Streblomastix strix]|uniref:Uncharacterized protein n=1 Tax=Streblomastix strix TaxID=222440 RepID=A0A5J4ULY0_9EUKA|nr:MAG: hypothetical protein EZS28_033748 [Streblomastix strix]